MIAIHDGFTTRTDRSANSNTSPDVSLIHSSLAGKFTENVLDDIVSDHKPIMVTYREMNSIPTDHMSRSSKTLTGRYTQRKLKTVFQPISAENRRENWRRRSERSF